MKVAKFCCQAVLVSGVIQHEYINKHKINLRSEFGCQRSPCQRSPM